MSFEYPDFDYEAMTLNAMGDGRKLQAVGVIIATEKLRCLLDETIYFHGLTTGRHHIAQRDLGAKRDEKMREFKKACSDQAWTNIGVILVEALATWGVSTLGKAFQTSSLLMKTSKAFGLVGNIDTALNVASDYQSLDTSDLVRDKIKTPADQLALKKAAETVKKQAQETFFEEFGKWSAILSGGVSMYLYFLKAYPGRRVDEIDARFTLQFISKFAAKIVADANMWTKLKDETPQPSVWEIWSSGTYNTEVLSTGFQYVLFEVTMIIHNLHGHRDCRGGEAESRYQIVDKKFSDACKIVTTIKREKKWWEH